MNFVSVIAAAMIGAIVMLVMVATEVRGTRDDCRRVHPGSECVLGWVEGERF